MQTIFRPYVYFGLAALLAGCTSWVDVTKVNADSDAKGFQYSLPATFLLVQPQPDGTATYSWVYLPDSDNTYAIEQNAFLSKFTLDVTLTNGLLGKVNAQSDDTAALAKLLDVSQATYAAHEQVLGTQSKAQIAAVTAAKTAVVSAKLALTQAQQEYDAVTATGSGATQEQILAANLKLIDARAALSQAEANLAALQSGGSAANAPVSSQQWGPILFRVQQDATTGVKLVAANPQMQFDTVTGATAPTTSADYTLKVVTTLPISNKTPPLVLSLSVDPPITGADAKTSSLHLADGSVVTTQPTLSVSTDGKTLTATFANGLPKGSYTFLPAVIQQNGQSPVAKQQVQFQVDDH